MENDFIDLPLKGIENNLSIGNPNHKIIKKDNLLFGILQLQINNVAEEKSTDRKLSISLVIEGLFSFSGDDEDVFRKMLFLNGNSTLYSIARAHIHSVTSMALNSGRVLLPMINFLKLAEEMEKE